jgi:Tfp pilus assembly protein PilO
MNEQPATTPRPPIRDQFRQRLDRLRGSRHRSMFGIAEIIGLSGSAVILVAVMVSYVYLLVPARSRLAALQLERSRLQTQLRNEQDAVRQDQSIEANVAKITESLDIFESKELIGRNQGRMDLYDVLNDLIRKNGLRNTSGPTYTSLDSARAKTTVSAAKSASTKWQSVYPGIAISLTLEGQYQNLRRLVRDVETNKQFLIINAVELERATEASGAGSAEGSSVAGSRGALVSLHLDMATYFRRGTGGDDAALEAVEH